jgi:hypothetical protein
MAWPQSPRIATGTAPKLTFPSEFVPAPLDRSGWVTQSREGSHATQSNRAVTVIILTAGLAVAETGVAAAADSTAPSCDPVNVFGVHVPAPGSCDSSDNVNTQHAKGNPVQ